ncbi:type II toxin-antitoxin system HigB family toxin [Spirulina major CS-329]|uniref:type II toxin-antitoxin system HigB family toxin n=1 Tax=Spirulina TaxID=1154 RepID=UPI00232FE66A|nr:MULTISPECIES: type II toxin-antitoxin system HigB family toxin [Spirulina]MDB9494307.1 type II toxin-antitoxin system HigB family toxin [Spirulina subsalsa CS-330]MDB9502798.1 type II toxin-antitoxin system HigB family toxin [Spirulina major CS-329]
MRIIATKNLIGDAQKYPGLLPVIASWCQVVKNINWQNLEEVKQNYASAEAVGDFTVFNIKGNQYRLIVGINYTKQIIYYKYLLTHAEYDKGRWKNDPYF